MAEREMTEVESKSASQTQRTQKVGKVVSDSMDKTVVISVDYVRRHPLYHKRITRTSKFMAHDEQNTLQDRRHRADRGDSTAVETKELDRPGNHRTVYSGLVFQTKQRRKTR